VRSDIDAGDLRRVRDVGDRRPVLVVIQEVQAAGEALVVLVAPTGEHLAVGAHARQCGVGIGVQRSYPT